MKNKIVKEYNRGIENIKKVKGFVGNRVGKKDGTGPRGGTKLCPKTLKK